MIEIPEQWSNACETLQEYWKGYGGIKSLLTSPFFDVAVLISIVCWWLSPQTKWYEPSLSILPNLLGFSIGGFAVLLVFSSDKFLKLISEDGASDSLFLKANIVFVHFIVVQVIAIATALIAKASQQFDFFALFLLFYSVFSALATCFVLFNIAQVYNSFAALIPDDATQTTGGSASQVNESKPH